EKAEDRSPKHEVGRRNDSEYERQDHDDRGTDGHRSALRYASSRQSSLRSRLILERRIATSARTGAASKYPHDFASTHAVPVNGSTNGTRSPETFRPCRKSEISSVDIGRLKVSTAARPTTTIPIVKMR